MQPSTAPQTVTEIELTLASAEELFTEPAPGRPPLGPGGPDGWDNVGATLGESGVTRLLRLLHETPEATALVIRLVGPGPGDAAAAGLEDRLRRWCRAGALAARSRERLAQRYGLRALVVCTGLLAVALAVSWALKSGVFLSPEGPLKTLIAEAVVIAGWVVMWRPIEMIVFDPIEPRHRRRLLERAAGMTIRVRAASVTPSP